MYESMYFILLGLCWGENTQYHGKQDFPYFEAAQRYSDILYGVPHGIASFLK